MINEEGIYLVEGPMCRWGMVSEDSQGRGFVRKETMYLTNSPELAKVLSGECNGTHRHVHLVNGRARQAQVYPPRMVTAILRAVRKELQFRGEFNELATDAFGVGPSPDGASNDTEAHWNLPEDHSEEAQFFDSVTGAPLKTDKVLEARKEELGWVHKQKIYVPVDEAECWANTGKAPITLKWVDRNKGDSVKENYRSRLVVREVKKAGQKLEDHELYSAMPPLEALKVLCSLMTSMKVSRAGSPLLLKLIDISRAHFYGESKRNVYTNLPEGDEQPGKCAKLVRSMYGTQDASSIWQETYSRLVQEHGIEIGRAWPAIFYDPESDARFMVHGDDFVILGDEQAQKRIEHVLAKKFEYRVDGYIGPGCKSQVMTVLNRIIEYDPETGSISYEADPKHAQLVIKGLDLDQSGVKSVATPSEKQKGEEAFDEHPPLDLERASKYRSLTMRAAYLSLDRADIIAESVKTLARKMSTPDELAWTRLKRLGRYLLGKPRVVQWFRPQQMYDRIRVFCDSDHAGCVVTRKSTTGMVTMVGSHTLKHSSTLQSTVSLSSGESEYYAIVKGASTAIGMKALFSEWHVPLGCTVLSDSSAARGMCSRRGLGKTRHVQTRYLWVQSKLHEREFDLVAVGTDKNFSDLCTKPMSQELCQTHMTNIGQHYVSGASSAAKGVT